MNNKNDFFEMLNGVVDIEERSDEMLFFVLFRSDFTE